MKTQKTHSEKTSADSTSIGFDFQYYYFLYRLLDLKIGETVGLEVEDDVHSTLSNTRQIFVQLKHTVKEKADGSPKNLTTFDGDLWKTLSNWSMIIRDKNANRESLDSQREFVLKTDFLLVSNKSNNEKNQFLQAVDEFKKSTKSFNELKGLVVLLEGKTKQESIKKNIVDLLGLDDWVLEEFFQSLYFELDVDDIIQRCKQKLEEKMVASDKINELFRSLDSEVRQDNFANIRNGKKIEISFEEFRAKYRRFYDLARNPNLNIKPFNGTLPEHLDGQIFIRQLVEIGDIHRDNIEEIAELTRHKLKRINNFNDWEIAGDITRLEIESFNAEAKLRWKNKHRSTYRGSFSEDQIKTLACRLVDEIREEKLSVTSVELDTEMSNGEYYYLSDVPDIGWHKDWEDKYK